MESFCPSDSPAGFQKVLTTFWKDGAWFAPKASVLYLKIFVGAVAAYLLLWFLFVRLSALSRRSILTKRRAAPNRLQRPSWWVFFISSAMVCGCAALSWAVFGSLIPGVLSLFFGPWVFWRVQKWRADYDGRKDSQAAFGLLVSIRGLLKLGVPFPDALMRIQTDSETLIAGRLSKKFALFQHGRPIRECLDGMEAITGFAPMDRLLVALSRAYREGLSLVPILDNCLPSIEDQIKFRERLSEVRRSAASQCLIAWLVPILIVGALFLSQPDMIAAFVASSWVVPTVVGGLTLQALGAAFVKHLCRFERGKRRLVREELIPFFETVALSVSSGFDLGHAWAQAYQLCPPTQPALRQYLGEALRKESFRYGMEKLAREFPMPEFRFWFALVERQYESGASVGEVIEVLCQQLRGQRMRELESFYRQLPMKVNLALMVFYFPVALAWLFAPLVFEMFRVSPG